MLQKFWRLLRHRWQPGDAVQRAVPPALLAQLTQQVADSERHHSGELRIYVEAGLPFSYLWQDDALSAIVHRRALAVFGKLRVWDTEHNNGVLIYLLLAERRVEIVADRGLYRRVPAETWPHLVQQMSGAFKAGQFEQGLTQAVQQVGALLQQHFPLQRETVNLNELPDRPVLG